MLAPDSRQTLLDALRPPPGTELDAAIATTFTLSLQAALVPALAFSVQKLADETKDPVVIMEAIRKIGDRTDVFCQAGCIAVPKTPPDLLAFVEPMIHQVAPPRGGLFHPKIWLLKFRDDAGKPRYRLLVLSRNLTNDNAWDTIVRLDSAEYGNTDLSTNDALSRLITSLPKACVGTMDAGRRRRVANLGREVRRVVWELPPNVEELQFHLAAERGSIDWASGRTLIISPFVNDGGLDICAPRGGCLVARPDQLDQLSRTTLARFETYVLNPAAGVQASLDEREQDQEGQDSSGSAPPAAPSGLSPDLHAKAYVLEPTARWAKARVLLGSANATSSAFGTNVEFLAEMVGRRDAYGIDTLVGDNAPLRPYLEPYSAAGGAEPSDDDKLRSQVESWLRSVASIPHTVTVSRSEAGAVGHDMAMTSHGPYPDRPDWQVLVGLLTLAGREVVASTGRPLDLQQRQVATADITPYVTVTVLASDDVRLSTVLVADLVNAPNDRLDVILARQIDTPDKLLRLIRLMLGIVSPAAFLAEGADDTPGDGAWTGGGSSGELELILRALATDPKVLDNLDDLIVRLERTEAGRTVLPADFAQLWQRVREARALMKAHS